MSTAPRERSVVDGAGRQLFIGGRWRDAVGGARGTRDSCELETKYAAVHL